MGPLRFVNPQIATSTPAHPEAQGSCWNLTNAATRKTIPLNAVVHHTNASAVPTYNGITEYDEGRGKKVLITHFQREGMDIEKAEAKTAEVMARHEERST
ncbi:hypothetical protein SCUP515_08652 [Seiridium cupressi]